MSRKIYVSSDMSVDEQLDEMAEEEPLTALMWPWFLTYLDDWGRGFDSARRIKKVVFPGEAISRLVTLEVVERALALYFEKGLIRRYEVGDRRFLDIPADKWFAWQTHIRQSKRDNDDSKFPAFPGTLKKPRANARKSAESRVNARECASRARLSPSPSPSPSPSIDKKGRPAEEAQNVEKAVDNPPTTAEKRALDALKKIEGYPFNQTEDLRRLRLVTDHRVRLEIEVEKFAAWLADYKTSHPKKEIRPRARFVTWLNNAQLFMVRDHGPIPQAHTYFEPTAPEPIATAEDREMIASIQKAMSKEFGIERALGDEKKDTQ